MSRQITVGNVRIGGGAPVSVQSMTDTNTEDTVSTLAQIMRLKEAGCDIVRAAVPDENAAAALRVICKESPLPVVADIHFNYRLAVMSAKAGAAKIRINPGNIGGKDKLREITASCKEYGLPIRVGVNAGSSSIGLVQAAFKQIDMLNSLQFFDICVSLKSSDVRETIEANRLFRSQCKLPLHLGVTEAGTLYGGIIRSSSGIGALLADNIGDTIRVSLTAPPEEEVKAALTILEAFNLRPGIRVISCPTCSRCHIDVLKLANEAEERLSSRKGPLTIAVMGCEVNGPGEASRADIGIAGGKDCVLLFKNGKILEKADPEAALDRLMELIT